MKTRPCKVCGGPAPRGISIGSRSWSTHHFYGWCQPCTVQYTSSPGMPAIYLRNILLVVASAFPAIYFYLKDDPQPVVTLAILLCSVGFVLVTGYARRRQYIAEKRPMPRAVVVEERTPMDGHAESRERDKEIE